MFINVISMPALYTLRRIKRILMSDVWRDACSVTMSLNVCCANATGAGAEARAAGDGRRVPARDVGGGQLHSVLRQRAPAAPLDRRHWAELVPRAPRQVGACSEPMCVKYTSHTCSGLVHAFTDAPCSTLHALHLCLVVGRMAASLM